MNKRVNDKVSMYLVEMKGNLRNIIQQVMDGPDASDEQRKKVADLIGYIYEYPRLVLSEEDFAKRKREKNLIPLLNRCCAVRSCGSQCTRKRKDSSEFCGPHYKGTPHGCITAPAPIPTPPPAHHHKHAATHAP